MSHLKLFHKTLTELLGSFFGALLHIFLKFIAVSCPVLPDLGIGPGASRLEPSLELLPNAFVFFTHTKEFSVFKRICRVLIYLFCMYLTNCSSFDVIIRNSLL